MFSLFALLIYLTPVVFNQEISRKICSTTPTDSACQQVSRNLQIACNYNQHSVDCLLNIKNNQSHIGRITGEEALLGANLLSNNVVVLAEITNRHPPSETVVIVKNDVPSNFISLKGKKLCHPGYKHDSSFSLFLLQELENKVVEIEDPKCNENITLLERHINTLSNFFDESCRPGPWSQNVEFDFKLKQKFSSLCQLCGDQKCDVDYETPFKDSLKCLLEKNADVAVTTLHEAELFFNSSGQLNYKYFCKDGTTKSPSTPCSWSRQLPDLLVTERSMASDMESFLRNNLKSKINTTKDLRTPPSAIEEALIEILKMHHQKITFFENDNVVQSLKDYVSERVLLPSPEESIQCDRTLKWCTYTNSEQDKCRWLSQAAVNWGIQPVVECVRSENDDEISCLDDVKKTRADIVVASSDYAFVSFSKGLTSIAFPETDTRNLSIILAAKRADDHSINTFQDFKGKRACIPMFGGKEHLALVDTTRRLGITDNEDCDYGKVLNDFVGDSCVPGVRSPLIKESTESVNKDKLCANCQSVNITKTARYCNADDGNKYFGTKGAVHCLLENVGDFAIITKKDIRNATNLKVICKNNTLALVTGLDVDKDCALFALATSEIVAQIGNNKKDDIQLALYEFEKWFGQNLHKPFHLFDRFNNEPDLLFLDSTPGLNFDNEITYIKQYKDLLAKVKDCNINASPAVKSSLFTFTTIIVIFFFYMSV